MGLLTLSYYYAFTTAIVWRIPMITTHKIPYRNGELRIGWASWDNGNLEQRSIKYAYHDSSGKISRGLA